MADWPLKISQIDGMELKDRKMFIKVLKGKFQIIWKFLLIFLILISVLLISLFHREPPVPKYELKMVIIALAIASIIWSMLIIIVLPPKKAHEKVSLCSFSSSVAILCHPLLWSYMFVATMWVN